ncbi:MAG: hypothetical protein LC631_01445, partial [Desulfovibrionales bacterium]|nr:hypothetical protein [Desulfovibrionales bacterium]
MNKNYPNKLFLVSMALFLLIFAGGLILSIKHGLFQETIELIHKDMPHFLFIILMTVLPVIGFPISIFLVLGGIKFGIIYGILLWLFILPL